MKDLALTETQGDSADTARVVLGNLEKALATQLARLSITELPRQTGEEGIKKLGEVCALD